VPQVDIICLANSNKMGGRCVAGLQVDGTGWVRPIAPKTDHGQLYAPHYKLNDGTAPEVLDVISIDLASHRPQPGQPENWVMGEQKWVLVSRPAGPELYGVLRSALDAGPSLLGSLEAKMPASVAARAQASLALVAPLRTHWFLRRYARPQPRVTFELNGQPYNLPITDPAWTSRLVRRLSGLESGTHPKEAIGISQASNVLFTVSLSEEYPDTRSCYKLVAGIIVMPDF